MFTILYRILEGPGIHNQQCARLPSTLCLFSEISTSGLKMFSFDLANGSSREISLPQLPGSSGLYQCLAGQSAQAFSPSGESVQS